MDTLDTFFTCKLKAKLLINNNKKMFLKLYARKKQIELVEVSELCKIVSQ